MRNKEGTGGAPKGSRSSIPVALEEKSNEITKSTNRNPNLPNYNGPQGTASAEMVNGSEHLSPRRGCKRKALEDMAVVSSAASQIQPQVGENTGEGDALVKTDRQVSPSLQWLPEKRTLEFVIDTLQRKDVHEIFAEPVDPEEVEGYFRITKEGMDFATMRAKLQEGMYTTLEQFEYDVFLISRNAMQFNSPTSIYYREAHAIHELAQKVFRTLKTDPENLELEFPVIRRRLSRKPKSEAKDQHHKLAKTDAVKSGNSPNGKLSLDRNSLMRNVQTSLPSSISTPYIDKSVSDIPSGSTDDRNFSFFETESGQTCIPWNPFLSENESLISEVYNASDPFVHINHRDSGFHESMMQYTKDLGPSAQMVADRKFGKLPVEAPNFQSQIPTAMLGTSNMIPSENVLMGPAYPEGVNTSQTLHSLHGELHGDSNVNDQFDVNGDFYFDTTYSADIASIFVNSGTYSDSHGEWTNATYGEDVNTGFLAQLNENTRSNADTFYSSNENTVRTSDNNIEQFLGLQEGVTYPNQSAQVQPVSNFQDYQFENMNLPFGYTTTDMMKSSEMGNQIPSAPLTMDSEAELLQFMMARSSNSANSSVYPETANTLSLAQAVTSLQGSGSHYDQAYNLTSLNFNNSATSSQASQPRDCDWLTSWCPDTVYNYPSLQMHLNQENPLTGAAFVPQGTQQQASTQVPFDAASLLEGAQVQIQQVEPNVDCFLDIDQQSSNDTQQPDLALQL